MKALKKLIFIETKLYLREPMPFFFTLIFPLMMLFLFGFIYGNEPSSFFQGFGFVDITIPAYIALIIATVGIMSINIGLSYYKETGVLKRYSATPLKPYILIMSQIIVHFLMTVFGVFVLIAAGILFYNIKFSGNLLNVFLAFTLSALSFFAIGFVISSVSPTSRTAQAVGMVFFFPMIFLSGATIPLEVIKKGIGNYVNLIPLTYVVKLMRGMWFGSSWSNYTTEILILFAFLFGGIFISSKTFRWE